jgi:DNA gyrase subunit B
VGVSAVNAVSEQLRLEIRREGKLWVQDYARGVPQGPLQPAGTSAVTGTTLTFRPDSQIFTSTEFSYDILASRLRELAFLNQGLVIQLEDERDEEQKEVFEYQGGIREFVALMSQAKDPIHEDVVAFEATFPLENGGEMMVDLALQWTGTYVEQIFCYTNNIHNKDGGTHLTGLRSSLTRTLNNYGQEANLFKDLKSGLSGDDTREGLICVIHVKHPDASFDSQTKSDTTVALVMRLLQGDYKVSVASRQLNAGGRNWKPGTFVIRISRNPDSVHDVISRFSQEMGVNVTAVNSGYSDEGDT